MRIDDHPAAFLQRLPSGRIGTVGLAGAGEGDPAVTSRTLMRTVSARANRSGTRMATASTQITASPRSWRRLRSERPADSVSLSALGVLATLRRHGALLAVDLAALERLKPQSLTRLLAGMERAGLIERQPSALDGRARSIALTARGRAILRRDLEARREWLAGAIARTLSIAERELLVSAAPFMLKVSEDADSTDSRAENN
jgi:DNA-binding MarR family transcriptional regulator